MTSPPLALPPGTVTGVGSLPQRDADEAVALVARYAPHLPFWPQLPQRSPHERMIEQVLGPLRDLLRPRQARYGHAVRPGCLGEMLARLNEAPATLDDSGAAGFFAFEQGLERGRFPEAVAIKGQLVGPTTLALNLFRGAGPGCAFADHALLREALAGYLARLARWQVRRLARFGRPVLIAVDEPALGFTRYDLTPDFEQATVEGLRVVLEAIRAAGGVAAAHCCSSIDHRFLTEARPDVWSFDAHQDVTPLCQASHARQYGQSDGLLAFGLVPTVRQAGRCCEKKLFVRWLQMASLLDDPQAIAQRSLVTATCGLGLLNPRAARQSFERCAAIAGLIRQTIGCPSSGPAW